MENEKLINYAKEALKNAHSPYSNIQVGAALITKEGRLYTGCNVENHGIQSICAERVAFTKAISEGERKFAKIAVMKKENGEFDKITPCGYCRQFMSEFVDADFEIITYDEEKQKIIIYNLKDLLPNAFA